jgi:tetratricopeptide (TPR) repeat protein
MSRPGVILAILLLSFSCAGVAVAQRPNADFVSAQQLYQAGRFAEAAAKFQAVVASNPAVVPAQVGLIHSLLQAEKLEEAQAAALKAIAAQPNSGEVVTAMGDVQFRLGEMPQAERSYLKAETLDPRNPAPFLGAVRVYRAYSLHRRAYDQLKRAYEIAPQDPSIQQLWFQTLPRHEQIASLQTYLSNPKLEIAPEASASLHNYLAFLKATAVQPQHPCRLVSNVSQTNTKLQFVNTGNDRLGGTALEVKVNGRSDRVVIDTGTTGILLRRAAAEKAGVTKIADEPIGGMGDAGQQMGYVGAAQRLRIGELEFQDCLVRVADNAGPAGQDGLIGTDVFSAYVIDLDIPGQRLRLSPLPKRPEEAQAETALNSGGEAHPASDDESTEAGAGEGKQRASQQASSTAAKLPQDAYVAPEMANWTKVFRFGHILLIPTTVDQVRSMLFMIDSGAFTNILSTRAAREVTQVTGDSRLVRGMSGTVSKVYRADKATLQFGHYYQQNQNIVTLDLSPVSRSAGTEVSGILGFELLRILQVKIDYRDGLVDFVYDAKHLPKGLKLHGQ